MSKKLLSVLMTVLVNIPMLAQIQTMPKLVDKGDSIDLVKYRVTYSLNFISDPNNRDFVTQDIVRLDIGSKRSKQYSYLLYQTDSLSKNAIETGRFPHVLSKIVPPLVIYKALPNIDDMIIDYRLPSKAPVMTYMETIPQMKWQIKPDKKGVIGYNCQKAEVTFGGRRWIAWFTLEIPVSDGPYKFRGLPGLILELQDVEGDYHYKCIGFSHVSNREVMLRWNWNQRPISKEGLDKIIRQLYANPDQALKALGAKTRFAGDALLDVPYNPIER